MADYVQGSGNASVKHDVNKRAIKASGFTIREITETAAYEYILMSARNACLTIQTMDEADRDFINNWESEKYRKSVAEQN